VPDAFAGPARRPWSPWAEARADLGPALRVAALLGLCGIPAGLLWWWLAPRADFRITADGPIPIGRPSEELQVADDVVLALILAALGVLAGIVVWRRRGLRGVAAVLALAVGTCLAGLLAWQGGELLGRPPTEAELTDVGGVVTTGLVLGSVPVLAVGPFTALLAYLVGALWAHRDDLDRPSDTSGGYPPVSSPPAEPPAAGAAPAPPPGSAAGSAPGAASVPPPSADGGWPTRPATPAGPPS
jgi:hypothetical protein